MGRCHPLVQRPADLWSSNLHSSGLRSLVGHNFSGTHFPLVWVRCSVAPRTEQSARTPKEKKSFSEGKGKNYFPLHPKNRICLRSRGSHKTLALPERVVCVAVDPSLTVYFRSSTSWLRLHPGTFPHEKYRSWTPNNE